MEGLIEALFEIFGELILNIIGAIVGTFFDYLNENSKVKKYVKSIVAFVFYGASIVLFIFSFIYHKKVLLSLTIGYFIVTTTIHLIKFTNRNKWNSKKINKTIKIIQHILHYTFPLTLIIVGSITLTDKTAKIWLIIGSILAIIIRFAIDIYKLDRKQSVKQAYINNIHPTTHYLRIDYETYQQIIINREYPIICINTFERSKIKSGDFILLANDYNKGELKVNVISAKSFKSIQQLYRAKRFDLPYKTIDELKQYLQSNYYMANGIEKDGLLYLIVYLEVDNS